jgi:hypothetical protein
MTSLRRIPAQKTVPSLSHLFGWALLAHIVRMSEGMKRRISIGSIVLLITLEGNAGLVSAGHLGPQAKGREGLSPESTLAMALGRRILTEEPRRCTHLNFVSFQGSAWDWNLDWKWKWKSVRAGDLNSPTFLFHSKSSENTDKSGETRIGMPRWDSKYHGGCSLVLIGPDRDSQNLWLDWNSNSNSNYNLNIPQAPAPAKIFHVFLRESSLHSTSHWDSVEDFALLKNATEFLYHVIFATMRFSTEASGNPAGGGGLKSEIQPELVEVDLTAWSWNLETMTPIGTLNFQDGGSELLLEPQQTQIFSAFPDWEGNAVGGRAELR